MLIVYFGAASECGCTMLTQSTANHVAALYPDKRVLILSLSGFSGTEYAEKGFHYSIDDLQVKLKSDVLTAEELESMCCVRKNLSILQGSGSLKQRKEYVPEDIIRLVKLAETHFEYIIADAGCSVENGMGLGALKAGGKNVLVVTQSQKAFTRFKQQESILKMLDIQFCELLINKFVSKHFLPSEKVVRDSYKFDKCLVTDYSDYGMQAEEEGNTLERLDKSYKKQMEAMLSGILETKDANSRDKAQLKDGQRILKFLGGKRNGGI